MTQRKIKEKTMKNHRENSIQEIFFMM